MALIEICNIFYLLLLHSLASSPSLEENPFFPGFHSQKDEASGSREVVFESPLRDEPLLSQGVYWAYIREHYYYWEPHQEWKAKQNETK